MSLENEMKELRQAIVTLTDALQNGAAPDDVPAAEPEKAKAPSKKPGGKAKKKAAESAEYSFVEAAASALLKQPDGRNKLLEILKELDVARVSHLEESQYAEALKALKEASDE